MFSNILKYLTSLFPVLGAIPFVLGATAFFTHPNLSLAQAMTLPQGVGAYGTLMRQYGSQDVMFDQDGSRKSRSEDFSMEFDGPNLIDGKGGADLQKLAQEVKNLDANSDRPDSMFNTLYFGKMQAEIEATVQGHAFGLAYGFHPALSAFMVVPFVDVQTRLNLQFDSDQNNAEEIRQRLGSVAFSDLQRGLEEAQNLSAQKIIQSIEDAGYEDPTAWDHKGVADIVLGGMLKLPRLRGIYRPISQTAQLQLELPTGYKSSPDRLNDISISKETLVGQLGYDLGIPLSRHFKMGASAKFGLSLPYTKNIRLPEAEETIVAAERLSRVEVQRGMEQLYTVHLGAKMSLWETAFKLGHTQTGGTSYSADREGNTAKLPDASLSSETFMEPMIGINTVSLFQRKKFPVPLIAQLVYHAPIQAKNSINTTFYEFRIGSFFKI